MALALGARAALLLHHAIDRTSRLVRDGTSALSLGLLGDDDLDRACEMEYGHRREFRDAVHNRSGLRSWEQDFVDRYLRPGMRVLVSAAGGGREVLALARLGFVVTAFECNTRLVTWGNAFLRKEGVNAQILEAPAGECPTGLPPCDAIVLGWASYHHIRPAERRRRFLGALHRQIPAGAPILLSFFDRGSSSVDRSSRWANRIRSVLGRPPVEPGDIFGPPPLHLFTRQEIEEELLAAGFRLEQYSHEGYPHAVGTAIP